MKNGRCVLIGDNLSSHFSPDIMKQCNMNNVAFCCLSPHSTHLCQPIDVSFFCPVKAKWRSFLSEYKTATGKKAQTIQKDQFPRLLKKLLDSLEPNRESNLQAGF